MDYKIRELKQNEISVLNTFLYEAIFIPDGVDAPPYEIINQPELQVYVTDFGKKKGVWSRLMFRQEQKIQKRLRSTVPFSTKLNCRLIRSGTST